MPQIGGKPIVSKATKTPKKKSSSSTTKRNFTIVIGSKEHGLYVSSSPSSAARKAVSKLCATDKKRKVQFHIREITQKSEKKTYGPYLGYIEKLANPIELNGRVIRYKPVAKLVKKTGKKSVVKKGGMRGGKLSNKKGGMNRTGASASSASINDSKKKEYPRNLHEVKTKEELLSLNAWVNFVKEEREDFMEKKKYVFKPQKLNNNNSNQLVNIQGYTYKNRENFRKIIIKKLEEKFENIPPLKDENLKFLINFIIDNQYDGPYDGLGPYEDESYFKNITTYVVQMKKDHPEWEPKIESSRDFINWHNID
jgi:hypothetical protein